MTKETLQTALDALTDFDYDKRMKAIEFIKEALETKDAPVAYINVEERKLEWAKFITWKTPTVVNLSKIPLYTTRQRTWVGLTDEEIESVYMDTLNFQQNARALEAKLKEKNT